MFYKAGKEAARHLYKVGKMRPLQGKKKWGGLDISIEFKKGSSRPYIDKDGKPQAKKMQHDYGYIKKTKGVDGDHVDVYLGPYDQSDTVFIVDQMQKNNWKSLDEQKVMLGFMNEAQAKEAYKAHYNDDRFFGGMKAMSLTDFKDKVLNKTNHGRKIAGHYQSPMTTEDIIDKAFDRHDQKLDATGIDQDSGRTETVSLPNI